MLLWVPAHSHSGCTSSSHATLPTQQIAPSLDTFRPGHDKISKAHIGPSLEAPQAAFLDQFIAKPAESKSGLVVVEMWAGDHAKPYIGEARTVACRSENSTNRKGSPSS